MALVPLYVPVSRLVIALTAAHTLPAVPASTETAAAGDGAAGADVDEAGAEPELLPPRTRPAPARPRWPGRCA
jgi:hypothetical protein